MSSYPPVDELRDRLHRAGWSVGETCFGQRWQVDGTIGENRLLAVGASQSEAWYRATRSRCGSWACWRRPARNEEPMPPSKAPLTISQILAWADDHRRLAGRWPHGKTVPVQANPAETWDGINTATADARDQACAVGDCRAAPQPRAWSFLGAGEVTENP
jgi:hypothetical protein